MTWTTPSTVVAGSTELTASLWNEQVRDNTSFLYTPPAVMVRRTSNLTSYTSNTAISWSDSYFDTDNMFSSGTDITIKTAGIYSCVLRGSARGNATITRILPRIFNGALSIADEDMIVQVGVQANFALCVTTKFAVNDVITARVLFSGGSGYYLEGTANDASNQTALSVVWLGSA